jgi:hypothetical protein
MALPPIPCEKPHPTSDFQVIDIAASGLGLKSRLAVN